MDIPNVVFINPLFDNNVLLTNSKLVIAIRGTTALKAMKYEKALLFLVNRHFKSCLLYLK